jgi:hypothetical protein
MLLKNFGVTRHGRVVFYDYDELCLLTTCNFRAIPTPRHEEDELSDLPWYPVAENDIFPEQFTRFLGVGPELKSTVSSPPCRPAGPELLARLQAHHEQCPAAAECVTKSTWCARVWRE